MRLKKIKWGLDRRGRPHPSGTRKQGWKEVRRIGGIGVFGEREEGGVRVRRPTDTPSLHSSSGFKIGRM